MDHESFDRLARIMSAAGTRRAALGALLSAGLLGTGETALARKKGKARNQKKGEGGVSAQAVDCFSLGHGANVSGCDYTGEDHSGEDLSSSRMVGTIFRDGILVGTDLSSSNMKNAIFRNAEMCGADLRSSNVTGANFRDADLTLANFKSSSGCGSILTNAGTTFCGTIMCSGTVNNSDCPGGPVPGFCCSDINCPAGEFCVDNECVPPCDEASTATSCDCFLTLVGGDPVCVDNTGPCSPTCSLVAPSCPGGTVCTLSPCCPLGIGVGVCNPPCGFPDDCTCASGAEVCADLIKCGEADGPALRIAAGSSQKQRGS